MLIKRKCNADPHRQLTALTRPDKVARQPAQTPNSPALHSSLPYPLPSSLLAQPSGKRIHAGINAFYCFGMQTFSHSNCSSRKKTYKTREHCNFHTFRVGVRKGKKGGRGSSKAARQLVGVSHRLVAHLNASNCLLFCCSCIVCRPVETFFHSTFLFVIPVVIVLIVVAVAVVAGVAAAAAAFLFCCLFVTVTGREATSRHFLLWRHCRMNCNEIWRQHFCCLCDVLLLLLLLLQLLLLLLLDSLLFLFFAYCIFVSDYNDGNDELGHWLRFCYCFYFCFWGICCLAPAPTRAACPGCLVDWRAGCLAS